MWKCLVEMHLDMDVEDSASMQGWSIMEYSLPLTLIDDCPA